MPRARNQACDCGGPHKCVFTCSAVNCTRPCSSLDALHSVHSCVAPAAALVACVPCPPAAAADGKTPHVPVRAPPPCLSGCMVPGCERACASSDHHHAPAGSLKHQCAEAHPCAHACAAPYCKQPCTLDRTQHRRAYAAYLGRFQEQCLPVPTDDETRALLARLEKGHVHWCADRFTRCGYL